MHRRTFIKCLPGFYAITQGTAHAALSAKALSDETVLKGLLDAMIPSDETPGARDVSLHLDIHKMLKADPSKREIYNKGLRSVSSSLSAHKGAVDWTEVVRGIERSSFFRQLRRDAMKAFYANPISWEALDYKPPLSGYMDYDQCGNSVKSDKAEG